jgi:hypothetical protein
MPWECVERVHKCPGVGWNGGGGEWHACWRRRIQNNSEEKDIEPIGGLMENK